MTLDSSPMWLLPVLVFVAEMLVVTFGTLRIIFVARGCKLLAPALGFFEVIIWLFAIGQVMTNLTNGWCFLAFAVGFTVGNYLGILIEKKLALGLVQVRIITPEPADDLLNALRDSQFGVTCLKGEGASGPVNVLVTVVRRKHRHEVRAPRRGRHVCWLPPCRLPCAGANACRTGWRHEAVPCLRRGLVMMPFRVAGDQPA
jgi:uncharacterized protein YebE (UPF0316 family)